MVSFLRHYSGILRFFSSSSSQDGGRRLIPPRRALMYVPGNDERKLAKIPSLSADCICLDMEDGVSYVSKPQARLLIRRILDGDLPLDFGRSERSVRFNSACSGLLEEDARALFSGDLASLPSSVQLPKVNDAEAVHWFGDVIRRSIDKKELLQERRMGLVFFVESALALINLQGIVKEIVRQNDAPFVPEAIVFGSDDYVADIGASRTEGATELLYARQKIVAVAKAHGLQAIDLVHINYKDLEGLGAQSLEGARMGFTGKQVIHPGQVQTVQRSFAPSEEKVLWAEELVSEFRVHESSGKGAFTFRGNMIDMPLVLQAQNILDLHGSINK